MDQFNYYLQRLNQLDVDYEVDSTFFEVDKQLQEISQNYEDPVIDEIITMGRYPFQPPLYELTIYYPISRREEIPPSPVTYRTSNPITPANIIDSIGTVYRSPLTQDNINAYIKINQDYTDLNAPILRLPIMGGPKLRDVVDGHPVSLKPYKEGYLLHIEQ